MTEQQYPYIDTDRFNDFAETLSERFSVLPAYKEEFASKIFACLQQHNVAVTENIAETTHVSKLDALYEKAKLITPTLTKEDFERLIDPTITMLDQKDEKEYVPLIPRIKKRFSSKKESAPLPVTLEQVANTIEEKFSLVSLEIDSLLLQPSQQLKDSIKLVVNATVTAGKTTNITAADYDYLQVLYNKQMILAGKERDFAHLAGDIYAADNLHHTPPLKQAMIGPYEAEIIAWKKKGLPSQRKIGFDGLPLTEEMKKKNLDYYTSRKAVCGDVSWLDVAVRGSNSLAHPIVDTLITSLDAKKINTLSKLYVQITNPDADFIFLLQAVASGIAPTWIENACKYATPQQKKVMQQLVVEGKGDLLVGLTRLFDRDPVDGGLCLLIMENIFSSDVRGDRYKYHDTMQEDSPLAWKEYFIWNKNRGTTPMRELMNSAEKLAPGKTPVFRSKSMRENFIRQSNVALGGEKPRVYSAFLGTKIVWTSSPEFSFHRDNVFYYVNLAKGDLCLGEGKAHICIFTSHEKKK